jgi:uncharacterized protein (TIGR03000 family)
MRKRFLAAVGAALFASALVLLLPGESQAQYRGGWYGGGRGGFYGGFNIGPVYGGYSSFGYGRPFYGNYGYGNWGYGNYGYGYGLGRYGYPYYGTTWGYSPSVSVWGYNPRPYGYFSSSSYSPSYSYYPSYSTPSYSYSGPTYAYNTPTISSQSFYPPTTAAPAYVQVRVAADAEVWFDGSATQQRGAVRDFVSPALDPSRSYSYQVRARWMENGEARDETRTVSVQGGQTAYVDFNRPAQ